MTLPPTCNSHHDACICREHEHRQLLLDQDSRIARETMLKNQLADVTSERNRLRDLLREFTQQPFDGGPYDVMMSVPMELLDRMQQEASP